MDIISKSKQDLINSIKKALVTPNLKILKHSDEEERAYSNFVREAKNTKRPVNYVTNMPLDFSIRDEMFDLIKNGKVFIENSVKFVSKYTTKKPETTKIQLSARYVGHEFEYSFLDNHPGILNVDKLKDIPIDYEGLMAVPPTVLEYSYLTRFNVHRIIYTPIHNGKSIYPRIVVSNKFANV
jgi:hypothetical protein